MRAFLLVWGVLLAGLLPGAVSAEDPGDSEAPAAESPSGTAYEDDPEAQGLFEDALPPPKAAPSVKKGDAGGEESGNDTTPAPAAPQRRLTLEGDVILDYFFLEGGQRFTVVYHLTLEEMIRQPAADPLASELPPPLAMTLRGNAEIKTEIQGLLAKGRDAACTLEVAVPRVPYQIAYQQPTPEQALVSLKRMGPVAEEWASDCRLENDPRAKLRTTGAPERWLTTAFEELAKVFQEQSVPLSDVFDAEATLTIPVQEMKDEQIGAVELHGEFKLRIQPPQEPR